MSEQEHLELQELIKTYEVELLALQEENEQLREKVQQLRSRLYKIGNWEDWD
jgi:polyhydroxyalkanoate synthesis regulator phasin